MKIRNFMSGFIIIMTLCLTGCSNSSPKEPENNVFTEVQGNLHFTFVYNLHDETLISKNVYNESTGITTEYNYFYVPKTHGGNLIGISVVTITKEGSVSGEFNFNVNDYN